MIRVSPREQKARIVRYALNISPSVSRSRVAREITNIGNPYFATPNAAAVIHPLAGIARDESPSARVRVIGETLTSRKSISRFLSRPFFRRTPLFAELRAGKHPAKRSVRARACRLLRPHIAVLPAAAFPIFEKICIRGCAGDCCSEFRDVLYVCCRG
jgi:hypothetical protein